MPTTRGMWDGYRKGLFLSWTSISSATRNQEPVAHNEVVGPLFTQEGTFVFKVTGGPEVREISEVMREGLKTRALETWLRQEVERGGREGWLKINFDSDLYAWALDEVRDARPPATTAPSGQT